MKNKPAGSAEDKLTGKLRSARQLQAARRYAEAEPLLRWVLDQDAANADALYILANMALEQRLFAKALELAERALAARPGTPDCLALKGRALRALGRLDDAVVAYQEALIIKPRAAKVLTSLGIALRQLGRLAEADDVLREAVRVEPQLLEARINLANVAQQRGRVDEAVLHYRFVLEQNPQLPEAHGNLAHALLLLGDLDRAATHCQRALERNPAYAEATFTLGMVSLKRGDRERAIDCLRQAVTLRSDYGKAWTELGIVHLDGSQYAEAIECFERARELDSSAAAAAIGISAVCSAQGRLTEALQLAQQAVAREPGLAAAHLQLAGCHLLESRFDEAMTGYGQALELDPVLHDAWAGYLFALCYRADAATLREAHGRWGEQLSILQSAKRTHALVREDSPRRLRVGFVSADFKMHSVAYFIEPLLERLDPIRFELFGYMSAAVLDSWGERLSKRFHAWRVVQGRSAAAVADIIAADGIDVLIDLSGHTAGNRMDAMALKPAPVQMTYLGYPTTTGVPEIDYRVTDWHVDPPGEEHFSTESLRRLPHSYFCYRPPADAPAVAPLPALERGHVTFASFNNLAKLSDETIGAWSRILHAVPRSRLTLKSKPLGDEALRGRFTQRLASVGIDPARVELLPWRLENPLAVYHEVDIALDSFPYNGATTTCEALWMGVPVVTFAGNTHPGRMGASLLHAAQLSWLVAEDQVGYVELATRLAGDIVALARLRSSMRDTIAQSALRDEAGFAVAFGELIERAWADRVRRPRTSESAP
jgi:predicted O-linked N-acetylglucosamine transferase (SPINDLY family)